MSAKTMDEGEREQVLGLWARSWACHQGIEEAQRLERAARLHEGPEQGARRQLDGAVGVVIVEPRHLVEEPSQEELRRERRHGQIESLDAQTWQAEQYADRGRRQPGHQKDEDHPQVREEHRRQLVAGVGADRHEAAGAERDLTAVADQNVEAQRRHGEDQERNEDGVEPVVAQEHRRDDVGGEQQRGDEPAVLGNGKDRLIGGVAGLELAGLAIEHGVSLKRGIGNQNRLSCHSLFPIPKPAR